VRELLTAPGASQEGTVSVQFLDQPGFPQGRLARVRIGDDLFPATLMDMPTVLESAKSMDGATYYKSGHVGQVLVVSERMMTPPPPASYVMRDGLTPPTRGIRDFWAANQPMNARDEGTGEIERVEAKLKRIVDGQTDGLVDQTLDGAGAEPSGPSRLAALPTSAATVHQLVAPSGPSAVAALPAAMANAVASELLHGQHTLQDLFGDSEEESEDSSESSVARP
jgi:transcription initiation factor TFIID subunit 7